METNKQKKKIFFLIPAFRGGGAERVISNIANNLDREKFEVGIITISEGGHKYLLSEDVEHFNLGKKKAREAIFSLIRLLRKEKPDVVVATVIQSIIILYLASFFIRSKTKIVSRLASYYSKNIESQNAIQKFLFKRALESSDYIVTISHEMKENLLKNIKIDLDKIEMIYNPIDLSYIRKKTKEEVPEYLFKKRPVLIACGRLTKEKGFSYLIRAFKDIKKSFPEAKLLILGEGELEEYLKKLSFSLGLKESVYFLGFQKNPFKYIARADIFIFSSLYEGLPSALIEAMACGVPIVSTDCTSGPKEILDNGKVGSLVRVGDSKDLASETIYLLKDDNKRKVYSKKARDKVVNFGIKNNIQKYNSLLNRI